MDGSHEMHWRVARPGRSAAQVETDLAGLVRYIDQTLASHFPRREGYLTIVESLEGDRGGVRISVMRGDFRASADVYADARGLRSGLTERALVFRGRAASDRLAVAQRIEARQTTTLASVGTAAGLGLFGYMVTLAMGTVFQPLLAIMALFVFAVVLPAGGFNLGAWAAERLGAKRRASIVADAARDRQLQRDLRKWRAATRHLGARGRALEVAPKGVPFRRSQLELEPA